MTIGMGEKVFINLLLSLVQTRIHGLRSFYDEGERHFGSGFHDLKAKTDHLTPEDWNEFGDFYVDQRHDLEELRELKGHFSIVGLFTVFELFLRGALRLLQQACAPKHNPKELRSLDRIKKSFANLGVSITEPAADWNAIKKMQAIRNCITHLGSRPNKKMAKELDDYGFPAGRGMRMELPDGYFEDSAHLVERVCKQIVKDCHNALKENRVKT